MPIDLYYSDRGPTSNAVLLLAKSLGVELNLIPTDPAKGETQTPEFIKLNPQHTIPTINDNGFTLWESRVILIYLAEKYGKDDSLYPKDAQRRAVVNQRLYFDLGTLSQKFGEFIFPQYRLGQPADPEKWKAAVATIEFLNTFLERSTYAAGDQLTVADFSLAPAVALYLLVGLDLQAYPNVARWYAAVQTVMPGWAAFEENLKGLAAMIAQMKAKSA